MNCELKRPPELSGNDLLLQQLALGLNSVSRWDAVLYHKANPNLSETDLEHVIEMRKILNLAKNASPFLRREIDFDSTDGMIIVHDIGEIDTIDMPALHRDDNSTIVKVRRQEEQIAAEELIKRVTEPEFQKRALNLYKRFENHNGQSYDKEALLARFIDKFQGDIFFYENIYKYKDALSDEELKNIKANIPDSLNRVFTPVFRLLKILKSNQARAELSVLINSAFALYTNNGFNDELQIYIQSVLTN